MGIETTYTFVQRQFDNCAQFYLKGSQMADQDFLDLIVSQADPKSEDQALDVACGAGFLVCAMAKSVRKAIGVDLSSSMLSEAAKYALSLGLSNTDFQQNDCENLPFANKSFDIVTCKLALHYFRNPQRAIGEMKRVAKSGARIVLTDRISSEESRKQALHNQIEKLRTPSKVRVYSTSQIEALIQEQGLRIEKAQNYEQYQDVDEWLTTTGTSKKNQQLARELILQSLNGDQAGLKLYYEGERLKMTHTAAVISAINDD